MAITRAVIALHRVLNNNELMMFVFFPVKWIGVGSERDAIITRSV